MNKEEHSYSYLMHNSLRLLVGEIRSCFRGIAVDWSENTVLVFFYIDGEISEALYDHCSTISTEIIACFSSAKLSETILRIDFPAALPIHHHWLYLRKESVKPEITFSEDYKDVTLTVLFALLGKIDPNFRGVAEEHNNTRVKIFFYIDGPITNELNESCKSIVDKISSLNSQLHIDHFVAQINLSKQLPDHSFNWVYKRMEKKEDHSIGELLWNVRERMLGEINPSLRGIACEWDEDCIILYFYHDGPVNSEVEDHYYCIGTAVLADYVEASISEKIIYSPFPQPLPEHDFWAYKRKEPFVDPT